MNTFKFYIDAAVYQLHLELMTISVSVTSQQARIKLVKTLKDLKLKSNIYDVFMVYLLSIPIEFWIIDL